MKVLFKMDNKIRRLRCGVKSVPIEEVGSKELRKHPTGLVGLRQDV